MTRRRKRSKKWISWLFLIILAVAAGVVCYFVYENYFKDSGSDSKDGSGVVDGGKGGGVDGSGVEGPEKADGADSEKTSAEPEKKKVEQYDGGDPNEAEGITGAITYAGMSGGVLRVRVNIDQYLTEGKCILHLVKDDYEIYNETVDVIDSAATATCQGFDVAVSSLNGKAGKIGIQINVVSGEKKGKITGEVNI